MYTMCFIKIIGTYLFISQFVKQRRARENRRYVNMRKTSPFLISHFVCI